jgi:hypothetical protein
VWLRRPKLYASCSVEEEEEEEGELGSMVILQSL